jgi:hypothetical protein
MLEHGKLVSVPQILLFYTLSYGSVSSEFRVEMASKRLELLKKYPIPIENLSYVFTNWKIILKTYEGVPLGHRRKVLLCRDLISASLLFYERKKQFSALSRLAIVLLRPRNLFVLIILILEKKRRDKIRLSQVKRS